jgi:hypothetical protein
MIGSLEDEEEDEEDNDDNTEPPVVRATMSRQMTLMAANARGLHPPSWRRHNIAWPTQC